MKRHFEKVNYSVIKGAAATEILKHLKNNGPNILVVSGAYKKGSFSRWVYKNMADALLKETKLPLLVVHQ